jgi:excisionase family DNA binding protein
MAGKFLSPEEAAAQLGVTIEELHRLVDRKKLFPMRDGSTLKFKADDIERHALHGGDESSQSGDLSLELDMPEIGSRAGGSAAAPVPTLSGIDAGDIVLGDAIDAGESIFSGEPSDARSASKTILRSDAAADGGVLNDSLASGISSPSLAGAAGASAADIIFNDSVVGLSVESEDLALESIVGASSPSLATGPATGVGGRKPPPASGTLAIDLSDVGGGEAGSRPQGSAIGLSGISSAPGSALSGVLNDSRASGISSPSLAGAAGASAADIIFNDSVVGLSVESEDLALESIVGASSPSLATGPATGVGGRKPPPASGTLAIDLSDVGGGEAGSRPQGSAIGLSGISSAPGSALSGVLDSGLSLEDGSLQASGIDLGSVTDDAPAPADGGTVLAGDDFELGGLDADDESASVVIATDSESGDSSFFGQTMVGEGSSFSEESAVPLSAASDSLEFSQDLPADMKFSILQVCGLVCCSLLLLLGGFVTYDLVRTIGSPEGTSLANPLLNAMADTFGWR